jgi:CheY-like chemotaxis protein
MVKYNQIDILLVEDNEANAFVIGEMIQLAGLSHQRVQDGLFAFECFQEQRWFPSLVLMDLRMPRMDGFQATRKIRALEATRGVIRIPIIATTANVFDEDRHRALECGVNDFLRKPFEIEELHRLIQRYAHTQTNC